MARRVVPPARAVERDRRDPVAGSDPREPISDRRQRHEPRRRHRARVADRPFGCGLAQEHDVAGRKIPRGERRRDRRAVAQQMIEALGPRDRIGAAVGRARRVHHAQHGHAVAQERDRHRRALLAGEKSARPIVRVDQPAIRPAGSGRDPALLAAPARRQEHEQPLAQLRLDLVIDIGMAAAAARPLRPRKLGRDATPGRFGSRDHGVAQLGQVRMERHRQEALKRCTQKRGPGPRDGANRRTRSRGSIR